MVGVRERIEALLRERKRDFFTIKQVADIMGISCGFARKELCILAGQKYIARVGRGLYRHPSGLIYPGLPDPRLRMHGLKVEITVTKTGQGAFRDLIDYATTVYPSPAAHRHRNNGSFITYGEWSARSMTITVHRKGLVEIWLKASNFPLHLLEVHSYLSTVCHVWRTPEELAEVVQHGWNIDFPADLQTLIGGTRLSVTAFKRYIVQIYQKAEDMARLEIHSADRLPINILMEWILGIHQAMDAAAEPAEPEVR